ncbi:right-handed parallel beta-helix repeat-containing protein [Pseudarthrobacter oxydans]|uniref:right-handed parallel beta-helix repeat-containing protein n=1 Tax=Pseudarthrobacter oxydans TaxID=1671 RepID=UPI003D292707
MTALTGASAITAVQALGAEAATDIGAQAAQYVPTVEKGAASGVATLDTAAKIPATQLPDLSALYVAKGNLAHTAKDFGAVGDGNADDTAACQAAINAAAGTTVRFTSGIYKVNQLKIPSNTTLVIDAGAVIVHTATGAVLKASGTQDARRSLLTENCNGGSYKVTAAGHGLSEGDTFRLASEAIFDASSTRTKYGELCVATSVAGNVITTSAPISGTTYAVAHAGYVQKVSPVTNVNILGPGKIQGMRSPAMGQYGIDIYMGRNILISGVQIENIDRRQIYFSDCVNAWAEHCTLSWAVDNTMGYGISIANASHDCGARYNDIDYVRHGFTTNNETAFPGIPRRILFSDNTVRSTSTALAGSMGGGDAIDTHTAAEDIWIERNTVLSSSGQGINFEARSGHIVGNKVTNTASNGISVHNESDLPGRISVTDNNVRHTGGTGIHVRSGGRGTTAVYEYLNVSNNVVADTAGNGVVIGGTAATARPELGVTAVGNTAIRVSGSYACLITNARGVSAAHNKGIEGNTTVSITDLAPSPGEDPGYLHRVISADSVTITPTARYVVIDTEAGAPSDNLVKIVGGSKGQIITIRTAANARDVKVLGAGNIRTVSAFTLDCARDSITLGYDGTNWLEQARSDFPSA